MLFRSDRLTDCSSLSLTSPRQSTTNHADNSPSPAATTFQFHLQIPFLPSFLPFPYIPSPHCNCFVLFLLPLLRWIPGTLSIHPIPLHPLFLGANASVSANNWISLIPELLFSLLLPAPPPPLPTMLPLIRFRRPDFRLQTVFISFFSPSCSSDL